jgi:16S rRNA (guanine527-N7)-methyltransferase
MGGNMEEDLTEALVEGARVLGVEFTTSSLEALDFFLNELMRWNRKMNLTGIKDPHGIVVKHFLDSVAVSPYISPGSSLLDVGSGAGFPCIVLKILDPGLKVTSIDSSGKKLSFQRHLIRRLGLEGADTVQARLPDPQVVERFNKVFDYAISRAFGSLEALLRIARPLIKDTGVVIAMKGKMEGRDGTSNNVAKQFNMKLQRTVSFTLPFTTADRTLLFFAGKESP